MKKKGLTEKDILELPALLKEHRIAGVAVIKGVSESTIERWIRVLRSRGVEITLKRGRPFKLKNEDEAGTKV